MFTGRTIEELIESVERAEQHAHQMEPQDGPEVEVQVRQVRDTFIYSFSYPKELVGAA